MDVSVPLRLEVMQSLRPETRFHPQQEAKPVKVQAHLTAIDETGRVVTEATFPPCEVETVPLLVSTMKDRVVSSGRTVARVMVDLALPPESPVRGGYRSLFAA